MTEENVSGIDKIDDVFRINNGVLYALRWNYLSIILAILIIAEIVAVIGWKFFGEAPGVVFVLITTVVGVISYGSWRIGIAERRLDYTQVFPAAKLYRFRYIILGVLVVASVPLLNAAVISVWIYAGLLVAIVLAAGETHITLREGYEETGGIKFAAFFHWASFIGFSILFAFMYFLCWRLSIENFEPDRILTEDLSFSLSNSLAFASRHSFVLFYAAELLFVIRAAKVIRKYCVATKSAGSAESIIAFQSKIFAALAGSLAICSHWIIVGFHNGGEIITFALVTICFALIALGVDWLLWIGERLVLGPRAH